jgi:hypothetical protein
MDAISPANALTEPNYYPKIGYCHGVGLLPACFIAGNNSLDTIEVLRPPII